MAGVVCDLTDTEGGLKFGVRLKPPALVEAVGSESSSDDQFYYGAQQLWLWPLPPPRRFEFVIGRKSGRARGPARPEVLGLKRESDARG